MDIAGSSSERIDSSVRCKASMGSRVCANTVRPNWQLDLRSSSFLRVHSVLVADDDDDEDDESAESVEDVDTCVAVAALVVELTESKLIGRDCA